MSAKRYKQAIHVLGRVDAKTLAHKIAEMNPTAVAKAGEALGIEIVTPVKDQDELLADEILKKSPCGKVGAIREHRRLCDSSLQDAKDWVEKYLPQFNSRV